MTVTPWPRHEICCLHPLLQSGIMITVPRHVCFSLTSFGWMLHCYRPCASPREIYSIDLRAILAGTGDLGVLNNHGNCFHPRCRLNSPRVWMPPQIQEGERAKLCSLCSTGLFFSKSNFAAENLECSTLVSQPQRMVQRIVLLFSYTQHRD